VDLIDAYNRLKKSYDLSILFSLGLYHKYKNVNRIYLDENEELKNINSYIKYLDKSFFKIFGNTVYVCLVDYTEQECNSFPNEELTLLKKCGIDIKETDSKYFSKYIEDEERYAHYLLHVVKKNNLNLYIKGLLSLHLDKEPYFTSNMFILSEDLKYLINLYDDRGVDVMKMLIDTSQNSSINRS